MHVNAGLNGALVRLATPVVTEFPSKEHISVAAAQQGASVHRATPADKSWGFNVGCKCKLVSDLTFRKCRHHFQWMLCASLHRLQERQTAPVTHVERTRQNANQLNGHIKTGIMRILSAVSLTYPFKSLPHWQTPLHHTRVPTQSVLIKN